METPRGVNPWTRCRDCSTYFLVAAYALEEEVAHTESLPWGQLQAGLALNEFKQRMFLTALRRLRPYQPPPARILDVGCSFGGFSIAATRAGYDVCGMDITPGAVEYVRSVGLKADCGSTPADLHDIMADSLDVVTCFDCHSLWPDQPSQLTAIHDKLKPGGYLVLRAVDKSWMFTVGRVVSVLHSRLGNRVMREAVNDSRFSMPAHQLLRQLEMQGFDVVAVSIWAAIHSHRTRWPAKISFVLGAMIWPLTRRNVAPGVLVIAKRRAGKSPGTYGE